MCGVIVKHEHGWYRKGAWHDKAIWESYFFSYIDIIFNLKDILCLKGYDVVREDRGV